MTHDPDQPPPKKDPKTELEDQLITRALEPHLKGMDPAERDGMRIFMTLFVKTHPAMQSMVARRVKEETTPAQPTTTTPLAPSGPAPTTSRVVTRETAAPRKKAKGAR